MRINNMNPRIRISTNCLVKKLIYTAGIALVLAGAWGWVWNIVKLIQDDFVLNGMTIARAIGIFIAPLGAVLGFL